MHVGDWGQHACLQSNYALTHFTSPCSTLLASFVTSLRRPCFGLCLCFCVLPMYVCVFVFSLCLCFCVLPVFVFLCSPCVCVIGFEHKTVYPLWKSKNWVPLTCDPLLQNWGKEWEERRRKKWQEVQVGASLGDVEKRGKQVKRKEESGKRSTSGGLSGMWEGRQRGGAVLAQTNLSPHSWTLWTLLRCWHHIEGLLHLIHSQLLALNFGLYANRDCFCPTIPHPWTKWTVLGRWGFFHHWEMSPIQTSQ